VDTVFHLIASNAGSRRRSVSVPLQQRMGFQQMLVSLREHWLYHGRRHHLLHLFQVQIHFILFGMPILPLIAIVVVAVALRA
jgi:hypothetical protein